MADIPSRNTGQQHRDERVHLRPRSAGMPALTVIQLNVDELIDDILEFLPLWEILLELAIALLDTGRHNRSHAVPPD